MLQGQCEKELQWNVLGRVLPFGTVECFLLKVASTVEDININEGTSIMGDTEQIVAEPDEMDVEDVEGLHPSSLHPQTPQIISQFIYNVMTLITSFGWYVVGLSALGYFLWLRLRPKVNQWKEQRERDQEAAELHKNPDKVLARERAIEAARQRMQEEYNKRAIAHAEKVQEVEEKKRQERIEDWERHERGEGYRNKTRHTAAPAAAVPGPSASQSKPSGKPRLRPEYNPLTGEGGGSCRFRPDRRGPSAGG
ncbi:selenoprotein S-like isoform X1 [Penaeus indicus]|uniref:selenoprotein S-like isoform X1 n=2 Tax=Penaeus indicus TaxID=29960 RepID=UPI00300C0B21